MATKGIKEESWFSTMNNAETMSVRVSGLEQDNMKSHFSEADEKLSSFCCFPRGRASNRKGDSLSSNLMEAGTPFARLDAETVKGKPRSRSVGRGGCCCCGPRRGQKFTVEVRAVDLKGSGAASGGELRTKGRWEIDVNEEYYKPPVWKQIIRKVRAHAKHVQTSRCEWVNYDPQSYEKNFDNGGWRDSFAVVSQHYDENDDLGTKERALHTALLQKFASSRSQQCADQLSPISSPLPVRAMSKEEIDKSKEDFVPIWQRRAATPIKLDLRQRSGSGEQ